MTMLEFPPTDQCPNERFSPPMLYRPQGIPAQQPITFKVSVKPNITVINNNQESIVAVLAGMVLGMAATLLIMKDDDPRKG